MDKFVERLKQLRTSRNLSQEQLAKETNLSKSAISFWENGDRIPNGKAIIILAKYFDVTADYLLGIEED